MTLLAKRLRSQVDAPSLHLQNIPDAASNPFGPALPPPSGFFAVRGAFTARHPLSAALTGNRRLFPDFRFPLGSLDPSGS